MTVRAQHVVACCQAVASTLGPWELQQPSAACPSSRSHAPVFFLLQSVAQPYHSSHHQPHSYMKHKKHMINQLGCCCSALARLDHILHVLQMHQHSHTASQPQALPGKACSAANLEQCMCCPPSTNVGLVVTLAASTVEASSRG